MAVFLQVSTQRLDCIYEYVHYSLHSWDTTCSRNYNPNYPLHLVLAMIIDCLRNEIIQRLYDVQA